MAITFDTTYYLQQYPDVAVAISRGQIQSAQQHYNDFGRFESRNPSAFFDTTFYLQNNPDVAAARVNPFQHFLQFGASEGRFATASADAAIDTDNNNVANEFNSTAYLAANADVAANVGPGKAFATAYQHYIIFGQFESRPGVPAGGPFTNSAGAPNAGSTISLTTGTDTLTGTLNNDTFRGDNTTTQASDTINGGAGRDTFSYTDTSTTGVAPTLSTTSVEVISVRNINGSAGTAATNETASFTFSSVTAGDTVTITPAGGATITYTAPAGNATGAQVAAFFADAANLPAGYTVASGAGNQLTLRATTAGNAPDLSLGGTGTGLVGQSVIIAQGTDAAGGSSVPLNVNSAGFSGATDFISENSTGAVTFGTLAQGQSVGVTGNGLVANGAVTANYAGTATSATVNVAGGTTAGLVSLTGAGLTSTTVNSSGAANTLGGLTLAATTTTATIAAASNLTTGTITAAGLTTLNVSGAAASVNVGALTGAVTTVDASGLTAGGLTATLDAAITSFKGGQGNDVVTTTAITSTTAGIINAGAGTDTLVVAGATDVNTAAKAALYTGFETLRVANSQDVSLISGITSVQVNAATSAVISGLNATQAADITLRGDQGTALTLTLANATGSSDVVTLKLQNASETAAVRQDVDVAGLSVAGVETLNVQSLTGGTSLTNAGELNSIAFASGGTDKLTTINLSGDRSVDLSLTNVANAVTVNNASTGNAALFVSAGATVAGSVINGTANADTFTLGTVTGSGVVTHNAGAGNDTFVGTGAQVLAAYNVIDGGAGVDTLSVSGPAALVDAAFQRITNVEKLTFTSTTDNVSLASGGFFDSNFKGAGVEITATALTTGTSTIDLSTFTGKATINSGAIAGTGAQSVTTGTGSDLITVSGAATTLAVSSGAGDDVVNVNGTGATTSATVTGGLGKDVITFSADIANTAGANRIVLNVGAGESLKTAYDSVTGFDLANGTLRSSNLNFDGTPTVAGNFTGSAVTGYTSAELTATNTGGVITFQGSAAANLTLAQRIEAVDSLINTDDATVAFTFNNNTYVFHDSTVSTGDSLVELVGVTATSLTTTATTVTAGALFIS